MTPEDLIGRSLRDGEYVLQEVLGRGGMATVYRAYSRSLDTDVAVKVLAPRLARDPSFRQRFHDEARSLAPLHHPNLIEVHHFGEEGDLVYIAMRLVEGGTLKQLVQAMQAPLDVVTTARLIGQVADALQLAHEKDLVHLDIKPANILLGRHDWPLWPLLADFGITQAVQHEQTQRGGERLAGTPLYMSPEQCLGDPIDGRSDEYSLAVTTFELLTGQLPFAAETTEMVLQRHVAEPPPRVREVNPAVPSPVEEVVLRGLSKSPDARYPTVREFGAALSAAAERARAVSLETKSALSAIVPNLIGTIGLVLVGPLLLTLLPAGALLGGRLPLLWPFQFALGLMLVGLLWGVRWHLIGLLTRGANGVLDAALPAGGLGSLQQDAAASRRIKAWRNAVVASVEGVVHLGYLVVLYRLLAVPALTILATLAPGPIYQAAALAVALVVVVLALGIVAAIYRTSGPAVAALILAAGWALATALPSADLALIGGAALVSTAKLLIGAVVLVVLLALRRSTRPVVAQLTIATLGPLLVVAQPGASPDQVAAGRRHLGRLAEGILDYGYLLLGYALLQAPLVATLRQPLGVVPAAILVSGVAGLIWALLAVRLRWIAGTPGAALGVVLGAPLLTTLPLFQEQTLGVAWPATVATWIVAAALILLLALVHSQVQAVGQRALGPLLDRGLAGTHPAPTEAQADRRARALGELAGAIVDVILLVVGYWIVGVPAVTTLSQSSGRHDLGSIVLAGVVLAALGLLAGPLRRALIALDETGGSPWARRLAAVPGLAVGLAALLVGGCAAVPAVLTAPAAAGDLALAPSQVPVVLVDWQHYLPWTPTQDQAAYAVSLSCSDGRVLGVFQEAFRPSSGAPMPSGNVGTLGLTQAPCSDWASTYFALRQAAGLPAQSSVSWDAVDVRAAIQPDGSADVVETHRVLFTNGSHASLLWPEAAGGNQGQLSNVGVAEGGIPYADGPAGSASPYFRVNTSNGQAQIGWWFPPVASPAVRTYTVHYRLGGAFRTVEGGQQFARQVLLPNRAGPVWRMTVEVTLPTAPSRAAQLTSTGVATRNGMIDSRTAWFEAENVPTDAGLGIVVMVPGSSGQTALVSPPPPTPPPTGTPATGPTVTPTIQSVVLGAAAVAPTAGPPAPTVVLGATTVATPASTSAAIPSATLSPPPIRTSTRLPTSTSVATSTRTATSTSTATPSITLTPTPATSSSTSPSAPAPTNTFTSVPTATFTPVAANTATPVPTDTSTPLPTDTPTPSSTATPSPTATSTSRATATPTSTASSTATRTPTATATNSATPTATASSTSTATAATLTLNPTSGSVNSSVTATGAGFLAGKSITITFGGGIPVSTTPSSCASDATGSFSCAFIVPADPAGTYTVTASDGTKSAAASFTVTPKLTLNPTTGVQGDTVTATGAGFAASKSITFTFTQAVANPPPPVTAPSSCTSATNGSFSCTFTVPVGDPSNGSGTVYTVTATDGTNSASASFTVFTIIF